MAEKRKGTDMKTKRWLFALLFSLTLAIGCGDDVQNFEPVIFSFTAQPDRVAGGDVVTLKVDAGDVDADDVLTYEWVADAGLISSIKGSQASWTAPQDEGAYTLRVQVSDGQNTAIASTQVLVWRRGDYYPIAIGNTWVYQDQDENDITFKVVDTIHIEGTDIESFVIEIANSDPELEDIVNYSYLGPMREGFGIEQYAIGISAGSGDTLVFHPWLPLYKFPLIPGDTWEVEFDGSLPPEGYYIGSGTAKYEVLAEESVTVPAGTFENVFSIRETFNWNLEDQQLDQTISTKWVAPDIGIIKVEQVQTRGEQPVETTMELVSYELR